MDDERPIAGGRRAWLAPMLWLALLGLVALVWRVGDIHLTPRITLLDGSESARGSALVASLDSASASTRVVCTGVPAALAPSSGAAPPAGAIPGLTSVLRSVGECYEARWSATTSGATTAVVDLAIPDAGPTGGDASSFDILIPEDLEASNAIQRAHRDVAAELRAIASRDLLRGERIGLPIAFIVLLAVTGSLVAALVPLVVAGAAVLAALGMLLLISSVTPVSLYALNVAAMIGLAIGIDYTLLCVLRLREARRHGEDPARALARSLAVARRAVLLSGLVVMVALGGLLLMPISVFRDIALGAIMAIATSLAAILTLYPAVVRIAGASMDRPFLPWRFPVPSPWPALGRVVTGHPRISVALVGVALAPLLWQATRMEGQLSAPQLVLPAVGDAYLEQELRTTALSLVELVIVDDQRAVAPDALLSLLGENDDIAPVVTIQAANDGTLTVVSALVVHPPGSPEATRAVTWLRRDAVPRAFGGSSTTVLVAGPLGLHHDLLTTVQRWQPWIMGLITLVSAALLSVLLRSRLLSLIAVGGTCLSVAAAVGTLVLVMQRGIGARWLGLEVVPAIELWVPIVLFCVMFGVSMDYHIFLVSRVRERFLEADRPSLPVAVRFGVAAAGGLVAAAALLMVAVFGAFATGQLTMVQQTGFGLAVAVLVDAFLVRLVLVPACMTLAARWIWGVTAPAGPDRRGSPMDQQAAAGPSRRG